MILEELIQHLDILEARELEAKNIEIIAWIQKVRASCLNESSSRDIISDLEEIREKDDIDRYDEKSPYYSLLLAYARDLFDDIDNAIIDVELAVSGFKKLGEEKDWQRAMSSWFYGLLLCRQDQCDRAKAQIENAIKIISDLDSEQIRLGIYSDEYKNVIDKMKASTANMEAEPQRRLPHKLSQMSRSEDPRAGQKTESVWRRFKGAFPSHPLAAHMASDHDSSRQQDTSIKNSSGYEDTNLKGTAGKKNKPISKEPEAKPTSNANKSHLWHITIPVDVQAIKDLNINSIPLEPEYIEKIKTNEEIKEHFEEQGNGQKPKNSVSRQRHIVIPGFPIYGQAGANPNGEPYDSSSEMADEVDETLKIKLDGIDYKVEFLDTYTISEGDGKRYGWLKVKGDSMNKATNKARPIPINDKDYVLFYVNRDLESCAGRIVVASLPDFYTQLPQLVVKRLVKDPSPFSLNSFEFEYSNFALRSESSLDEDPRTGMSYQTVIRVINDGQITGEVIAIAKPI